MALAYSYIRFSSAAQGLGDSLRRQSSLAEEWCAANGIAMAEDYRDLGVSAFRGRNGNDGALGAFLEGVTSGRIARGSYLLVESLDRVSRAEVERAMALFLQIVNAGIIVVTLADGHVYQSGSSQMMIDLMYSLLIMSRAHEESLTKSRRLSAAWRQKRADYLATGRPITAQGPSWLRLVDGKWQVIQDRAETVREIFRMSASGHTYASIVRHLNESGVPCMGRAKKWRVSSVAHLLDSRSVMGEFAPKQTGQRSKDRVRAGVFRNYYPQIVTPEMFARAKRPREADLSMRGRKSKNLFRGLVRHPDGRLFFFAASSGSKSRHDYLRAHGHFGERPDALMSWRYDLFVVEFLEALNRHIAEVSDSAIEADRLASARERLAECDSRIDNLVRAIAAGYSPALEAAVRAAETERASIESEVASLAVAAEPVRPLCESDPFDELSRRIRSVVKWIVMDPENKTWTATLANGRTITRTPCPTRDGSIGVRRRRKRHGDLAA